MIVTCQNCETSFQLDDARVPAQGIKVRCSRCKQAFFLAHPSASKGEAIHAVAASTAARGGKRAPAATQDLTEPNPGGRNTAEGAAPRGAKDEDENDWQFNVDPPADARTEVGGRAARGAEPKPPKIDSLDDLESSGLSLQGEDDDDAAPASGAGSAFGSVDDFSSLMAEDESGNAAAKRSASARPAAEARGAAPANAAGTTAAGEDLGDPESWDFFGDDSGPGASAPSGSTAVLGRIALTSVPGDALGDAAALPGASAWDDDAYVDGDSTAGPGALVGRAVGLAGRTIGWGVTLSLVAVGLVGGFWQTAASLERSPETLRIAEFEVAGLSGRFVDTARGETLLWVEGQLHNRSANADSLDGILEIGLLGADGRVLEFAPQPAGTALAESDVRELGPRALRAAVDRAAWALAYERLAPNQSITIHALLPDVPHDAARFSLSLADAPAGAPAPAATVPSSPVPIVIEGLGASEAPAAEAAPAGAAADAAADAPAGAAADAAPASTPERPRESGLPEELTWGE